MTKEFITIPNILSSIRISLVPVLLVFASQQLEAWFLSVLAVSLATDALDGYLARKLNQASQLGARLDSWGDALTYGAMVLGLLWLWPDTFAREALFLYIGMACYLVPTALGLFKFGQLPSFHTWSAKISAVAMVPAYYMMVMLNESLLFRGVVIFDIWVALEAVFITVILKANRNNVPTIFHAMEIMRRQAERFRERRDEFREKMTGKKE